MLLQRTGDKKKDDNLSHRKLGGGMPFSLLHLHGRGKKKERKSNRSQFSAATGIGGEGGGEHEENLRALHRKRGKGKETVPPPRGRATKLGFAGKGGKSEPEIFGALVRKREERERRLSHRVDQERGPIEETVGARRDGKVLSLGL